MSFGDSWVVCVKNGGLDERNHSIINSTLTLKEGGDGCTTAWPRKTINDRLEHGAVAVALLYSSRTAPAVQTLKVGREVHKQVYVHVSVYLYRYVVIYGTVQKMRG